MTSFNHYAYGAVGAWLVSAVAGMDIGEPGYRKIRFKPRPGGSITHASARLETPHGQASISWRLEPDSLVVDLEVPPGTSATLDLAPEYAVAPSQVAEGRHALRFARP